MARHSPKAQGLMSTKRRAEAALTEMIMEQAQASLDFRVCRIPTAQRHLMVNRYYMVQLRSRSRTRGIWSQFQENFSAAVRTNRDIRGFIGGFVQEGEAEPEVIASASLLSADEVQADIQKVCEATPPPFWSISEETALELIDLAGRLLVGVKQFQDHPANKGTPERGSTGRWPAEAADEMGPSEQDTERAVDRFARKQLHAEYGGRQSNRRGKRSIFSTLAEEEEWLVDLEMIFESFTPRLEEEAEQNQENRRRPSVASTAGSDIGLLDADKGLLSLRSATYS